MLVQRSRELSKQMVNDSLPDSDREGCNAKRKRADLGIDRSRTKDDGGPIF